MKIVWDGLFNYFSSHLIEILEKADYKSILLKIEKIFPQIIFIKLYYDMKNIYIYSLIK